MKRECTKLSRRGFLKGTSAALATFTIAPAHILGGDKVAPNDRIHTAFIGSGGRGRSNLRALHTDINVVGLCDVDFKHASGSFAKYPQAPRYRDFRIMLDELDSSIDAVAVSTPDHTHAVAAMAAIRRGKHVYCEKPLAHSVHEIRALTKAAQESGVVTQMGNQGHSSKDIRNLVEWVRDGAIGRVHTIHARCSANHSKISELGKRSEKHPIPKDLDWDLWLGPAEYRDFNPMYVPNRWRGWKPFGNGTIGDWVCHVLDPSFWALDLGAPRTVRAVHLRDYDVVEHADTFPSGSIIDFEFPAKGDRGPVMLHWYNGVEEIPQPREADEVPPQTGAVLVGDRGTILHGSHGAAGVRLVPEERMRSYKRPPQSIPRVKNHRHDFVTAIREGRKASSDFAAYGGPLTEIALLGVISMNFPGRKLTWDGSQGRFTDCEEANHYIAPPYREGWSL